MTLEKSYVARVTAEAAAIHALDAALSETLPDEGVALAAFENPDRSWTLSLHFAGPPNEAAVRALVALSGGAALANALRFEPLAAKDWVAAALDGLTPVAAGRFLVHGRHHRARLRGHRIGIEIEAALAFGTGHHGTTRGCLTALDGILRRLAPGARVLDVGTGTGVLAIAAARALRRPVLASDIDERAVAVARQNIRNNGVAPLIDIVHAGGLQGRRFRAAGPFDLIFANILLGPLRLLARPMAGLVSSGGRVVLSGLLAAQAPAALAAYRAQGLVLERRILLEGWATLVLKRPSHCRRQQRPIKCQ
ncbi:MAG TPA: 50S ribosomal protein L11 methyltransferase [Xanthobacteraceae bacterium]|nr:50S ribosomal protein L11 methyltransferase [Xanthobacteraceae bacterium]